MTAIIGFVFAGVMKIALGGRIRIVAPTPFSLVVLAAILGQAFIEECYFRGILYVALSEKLGEYGAMIPIALAFAYWHPLHRLDALPIALVLGLARIRTKSVAACLALHVSYNVGAFLLIGLL
jgi:membrane protease YdiL (CAAX protease family)